MVQFVAIPQWQPVCCFGQKKKATLPQPILCLVGRGGDKLADNGLKVVADLHLHGIFILVDGKNDCALECVNDLNALYRIGPKF